MIKPYYQNNCVTLYCGECLEIMEQLKKGSFDIVLTDPPYCSMNQKRYVCKDTGTKYLGAPCKILPDFFGENRSPLGNMRFELRVFRQLRKLLRTNGTIYWFSDWRRLAENQMFAEDCDFALGHLLVWDKGNNLRPSPGGRRNSCEYVQMFCSGNGAPVDKSVYGQAIVHVKPVSPSRKFHQTQKPTEVLLYCLEIHPSGLRLLDPFSGSGSTGIACIKRGIPCVLIEQSERYCDIQAKRFEKFLTGGEDAR